MFEKAEEEARRDDIRRKRRERRSESENVDVYDGVSSLFEEAAEEAAEEARREDISDNLRHFTQPSVNITNKLGNFVSKAIEDIHNILHGNN